MLQNSQPINLSSLNKEQREAVLYNNGSLLVLAGAGTGKTKVLTEKIIYLINSYLANSRQILAVTFTNKAATEMKQRIAATIGDEVHNIWVGTFHSIATRILKRHPEIAGLKSDFSIIDNDDQLRLIKQILINADIDIKNNPPKNYLYRIERLKDKGITYNTLPDQSGYNDGLPKFSAIYRLYQERLQTLNAADFGDLLLYNVEIFKKNPAILSYYQDKFRYILVDEYQDTNNIQYQWLLKLAGKYQNITAVGDDDQSIYSWRGAEIANILRFEKDFPGTKIVRLEQNYRSVGNILHAASELIKKNNHRHSKTLWTEAESGNKIHFVSCTDDRSEANHIAFLIKKIASENTIRLNNIAILIRAGYQSRTLEEAFIQQRLPYRIIGGLRFYERKEIKDAIAYLRVAVNSDDDLALERIINLPKRGIGDTTVSKLLEQARTEQTSLFQIITRSIAEQKLKGKAKEELKNLTDKFLKWQKMIDEAKPMEIAKQILTESLYLAMWQTEKTPDAESRIENLEEFINSLDEFSNLKEFLEHASLNSSDEQNDSKSDMINIMTVHSAKGLEFDTVFIPGLEEGVFPSSRAMEERDGLEEERRLLYVAITRAKRNIYLTSAAYRMIFGNLQPSAISRFIRELPEEIILMNNVEDNLYRTPNLSVTNHPIKSENGLLKRRIFHQKFGYGIVQSCDNNRLTIAFEKSGTKTIMKDFVQLV